MFLLLGAAAACAPDKPAGGAGAAADVLADAGSPDGTAAPAVQAAAVDWPEAGRYGCAESIPRMVAGSFEYSSEGRGFLAIDGRGGYTDPFGVDGSYRFDTATGESRFAGGALDGAVVTPLEGEGPRLWVVIPTESGERRWSCSRVEDA